MKEKPLSLVLKLRAPWRRSTRHNEQTPGVWSQAVGRAHLWAGKSADLFFQLLPEFSLHCILFHLISHGSFSLMETVLLPSETYSFCNTLERKATETVPQKQILDVGSTLGSSLCLQTRESCDGCPRTMGKVSHSGEKFVCFCPIPFCLGLMLREGTPYYLPPPISSLSTHPIVIERAQMVCCKMPFEALMNNLHAQQVGVS